SPCESCYSEMTCSKCPPPRSARRFFDELLRDRESIRHALARQHQRSRSVTPCQCPPLLCSCWVCRWSLQLCSVGIKRSINLVERHWLELFCKTAHVIDSPAQRIVIAQLLGDFSVCGFRDFAESNVRMPI